MKPLRFIKSLTLTSIALTLGACATSGRLSPADRAAIRSVAVQPQVAMPTKYNSYSYMDLTSGVGSDLGLGGGLRWQAIGAAAIHSSASSGATLLDDSQTHSFPIEPIVRDTFTRTFQESGVFPCAAVGAADATITLTVAADGLEHEGLGREIIPFVAIKADLSKAGGKAIFTSMKKMRAEAGWHHTFEEFHANPQLLRAGWEDAARKASQAIVEDLRH